MQYEARSPEAYLAQLEDDWRKETLLQIRALIQNLAPELDERIHYKMLGYGKKDRFAFHLNAQKGYVSLYAGNLSEIDPDGTLLKELSVGKGCIRFSKTKSVSGSRIDAVISRCLERWKAGKDTGC